MTSSNTCFSSRRGRASQLREKRLSRNRAHLVAEDSQGMAVMDLKKHIRSIPDFPKPGILFYDISTLLAHPRAWRATVERLAGALQPYQPDLLVGIESRGFLVAAPLAFELGRGFAMVRKRGKLPGGTARLTYDLEYGTDTI